MAAQIDGSLAFTYRLALEALRNGCLMGRPCGSWAAISRMRKLDSRIC